MIECWTRTVFLENNLFLGSSRMYFRFLWTVVESQLYIIILELLCFFILLMKMFYIIRWNTLIVLCEKRWLVRESRLVRCENLRVVSHTDMDHLLRSFAHQYQCVKLHKNFYVKRCLLPATNSMCTVLKKIHDCAGFMLMYTNADLKISLYVCVHIKTIPWKFRIPNPKNSGVICSWSLQIF